MRILIFIMMLVILPAGCYSGKEHRLWHNRVKKNLPDSYFYHVLRDSSIKSQARIVTDHPYVHVGRDGYFHPYVFGGDGKVYSDAWRKELPTLDSISGRQHFTGYYNLYGDTLVIEKIASWTLGRNIPWKFVHDKTVGIISGDTIKLPRKSVDIDQNNSILFPLDDYLILDR